MSQAKKKRSNEQRLKAVQAKKSIIEGRQLRIKVSGGAAPSQHVVFSSDSEMSGKEDGSGHTQKMKLFGADGSSRESDSEQEELDLESKFSRYRSEELFRLQHKIGVDARFKVDDRFLEEEEEGQTHSQGDNLAEEFEQEKANALKILSSLFGGTVAKGRDGSQLSSKYSLPVRYDPSSEGCTQLELGHETSDKDGDTSIEDEDDSLSDQPSSTRQPQVSTDRYYDVSLDIKDMFSTSHQQFTFLGEDKAVSDSESSTKELPPQNSASSAPQWIKNASKLTSGDAGNVSSEDEERSCTDQPDSSRTKLFFHSDNPNLCNRLNDNNFYRSQPLSRLEAEWPWKRNAMKQSFRKRRKDAVKLSKKKRKHAF